MKRRETKKKSILNQFAIKKKKAQNVKPSQLCLAGAMGCLHMLCLILSKYGAVHYGQTCPLWSDLSKERCSSNKP